MNYDTFSLSNAARSTLIDVVKLGEKAGNQLVKAADQLIADGLSFVALETEKKGGSPEVRAEVKAALFQGLTKQEQEIINADVKTLNAAQKVDRNEAKNKIDSYLRKVRNHMMPEVEGDAQETKTEVQRIQGLLEDAITKLQKLAEPTFDVTHVIKTIKAAKGAMPAV